MDNPFRKRASENVLESEAFLQLVSPEPVEFVLTGYEHNEIYDKLVILLGTPGSGKTTLGRLFEYRNLRTLEASKENDSYKHLAKVLVQFGAISDNGPSVLAARLVMDSEYRGIWELPYEPPLKQGLFLNLLQCRCILLWLNALKEQGIQDEQIEILTSEISPAARESIGSSSVKSLRNVATLVEEAVYKVVHSLVPLPLERIPELLTVSYDPLSTISGFKLNSPSGVSEFSVVKPMIMVDDAHELHSKQFTALTDWLIKRELRVARWVITRFDIATSVNKWIQRQDAENEQPGRQLGRDYIVLETNQSTNQQKKRSFRSAANDIASRYLELMPIFDRSKLTKLSSMLDDKYPSLPKSTVEKLRSRVNAEIHELNIAEQRIKKINELISNYSTARQESEEVRIAMLRILAYRYAKRTPQQELFAEIIDPEPKRELSADIGVLDGARLFLLHEYERPYYYGFDSLVDAGGGNIEQFLKSADAIVSTIESRLIRKKPSTLDAADQHKLIKSVAERTIQEWDFPMCNKVKALINFIGNLAQDASLTPNAYLDHGANAYGVLQSDFDKVEKDFPVLAQALHYAAAYNAVTIIPSYGCKNQMWTLLELGGYPIILHGLTFKRGGFVEGKMSSLNTAVVEAID